MEHVCIVLLQYTTKDVSSPCQNGSIKLFFININKVLQEKICENQNMELSS